MAADYYTCHFERQMTGTAIGETNCAGTSGAMFADQATLGRQDPTPDRFRRLTADFQGGLQVHQVGDVLDRLGIPNTVYDASDGYTFAHLVADLGRGKFAVTTGDYDQVPDHLAGSRTYNGLHAEFWHHLVPGRNGRLDGITVADPLRDGRYPGIPKGWCVYPMDVARRYVEKFDHQVPGNGLHAVVMDRQRVRVRQGMVATIRTRPDHDAPAIGLLKGRAVLTWGAVQQGETYQGSRAWYRVWHPPTARVGYVRAARVVRV
jgi:hypothetical protein